MSYDRSKDPMLAMDYARSDAPRYSDLHREITELKQQRDELLAALKTIKKTVCGERIPNWESDWNTTHTRGIIADVCDIAIAKVKGE